MMDDIQAQVVATTVKVAIDTAKYDYDAECMHDQLAGLPGAVAVKKPKGGTPGVWEVTFASGVLPNKILVDNCIRVARSVAKRKAVGNQNGENY